MAQLIGKRYANALFELAAEDNLIDEYHDQTVFILETFEQFPELMKILEHPHVPSDEKMNLLEQSFKNKINDNLLGLFNLVFRKNREDEIKPMLTGFIEKVKQHKGITEATLYSAIALSAEQISTIQTKLSQKLNKQVTIVSVVDPTYIGGLCIKVDGLIMDGTVKKQLEEVKTQLLETKLA